MCRRIMGDRGRAGHWMKMSLFFFQANYKRHNLSPTGHEINVYPASRDQRGLAAPKLLPLQPDRHGQLQKMAIKESVTASCVLLLKITSCLHYRYPTQNEYYSRTFCVYWLTLTVFFLIH